MRVAFQALVPILFVRGPLLFTREVFRRRPDLTLELLESFDLQFAGSPRLGYRLAELVNRLLGSLIRLLWECRLRLRNCKPLLFAYLNLVHWFEFNWFRIDSFILLFQIQVHLHLFNLRRKCGLVTLSLRIILRNQISLIRWNKVHFLNLLIHHFRRIFGYLILIVLRLVWVVVETIQIGEALLSLKRASFPHGYFAWFLGQDFFTFYCKVGFRIAARVEVRANLVDKSVNCI